MTTLVRAAVALAAALLGFGGFVAVQAASGSDDQPAKREDSLSVLTTADDSPSPADRPSPDDSPAADDAAAVQQDAPAVQDDAPDAVADPSTRTGRDAVDDRDDTRDVTDATGTQTRTRGDDTDGADTSGHDTSGHDTSGHDTSGHDGDDNRSGSNSGRG
jgi:hypothetical protein